MSLRFVIVFLATQLYQNHWFHAIFMPVIIEFSRCIAKIYVRSLSFIIKKENEGKNRKQAKIAGLNKFLQIYYARVMEIYKNIA